MIDLQKIPHEAGCICHATVKAPDKPFHWNCNCQRREIVELVERAGKICDTELVTHDISLRKDFRRIRELVGESKED